MTARDHSIKAMRELRIIAIGEEPEGDKLTEGPELALRHDASRSTYGNLWCRSSATLTLDAGVRSLKLPSEVRTVYAVRIAQPSSILAPVGSDIEHTINIEKL